MTEDSTLKGVSGAPRGTPIQQCVQEELHRYFQLLDGQVPSDLYRMVISQVESALLDYVMAECRGNQSKAATWLGISRGTLRVKLNDHNSSRA